MKCEFDYEKSSLNSWTAFGLAVIFGGMIILSVLTICMSDYGYEFELFLFIFAIFGAVLLRVKLSSLDGGIICGKNSIAVCHKRRKRIISFESIESVLCVPEVMHTRYSVKHYLVFTVTLKTDKKLEFCKELDIDKDFPVQQPEKFREYIDEQPMMKLYEYINEMVENR